MNDHDPNMPALRREWLAARIMAVLGVLLLVAVGAGLAMPFFADNDTPVAAVPESPSASAADDAEARRQEGIVLCDTALTAAQSFGLLPAFATRDGDEPKEGTARGHYICGAKTDAATYTIAFGMACTEMGNDKCIVLNTITMNGGTILYQRR